MDIFKLNLSADDTGFDPDDDMVEDDTELEDEEVEEFDFDDEEENDFGDLEEDEDEEENPDDDGIDGPLGGSDTSVVEDNLGWS